MHHQITRRGFLGLGLGAMAWACGRPKSNVPSEPNPLSVVQVTTEVAVGDRRMSFALFRADRTPYESPGNTARAVMTVPSGQNVSLAARAVDITFGGAESGAEHPEEAAEVHRIFVFEHDFGVPGLYQLKARAGGSEGTLAFEVLEQGSTVMRGQRAVASLSPTTADPRGVSAICTRIPPCPMHELTIAQALEAGKPSVIVFATPKFCTSRTCGPLVDIVESAKRTVGDQASFVHIEIWRDDAARQTAPTVEEWKVASDPWLFFVGADGMVKDRWSGAAGKAETQEAVKALVAGRM